MKYLLLSLLVVLVAVMAVPDAFAKMYTDPDNRFTIEYPYSWITNSDSEESPWILVKFFDKYDWDAWFRVELYEDVSYVGTSDSNILEEIIESEREYCNTSTYQVDGLICYNFKVNDSSVVYTDENRKAYFIDQQYTKQWEDPNYPGEYSMKSTVLETHVGNDVWMVSSEIDTRYLDKHLDKVISSSYSFNLSPGSTSTSFKEYTDDDNRFTIEYPSGWILDSVPGDWSKLVNEFSDKRDWDANFRIWFFEDIRYAGTSDSNILEEIIAGEREACNGYTYQDDGIICYNFKVNDSSVVYTDENRKAYFIDQQYTKQYSDPNYPGEHSMRSTVLETHVGNDAWYIDSEIKTEYLGKYLDKVIKSSNSFKLLQGQSTTPTYEDPISSYWGSAVELNKVYYKPNDVVNFVIVAPNFNTKSNVVEYIGTDANSRVTIITSQGTLDFYKLKETGVDTGVFEGSISLNSVSTTGVGPWSGNIKTSNKDTITVQFSNTYSGNVDTVKAQGFVEGPSVTTPTPTPPAESVTSIPHWVKSNAGWWADGTINDSSFLQGIEYLINEGIIVIPPTTTSGASDSQEVPSWIKNNAGWWQDGTINDNTFISGIQYLVQVGIIQVG